MGVIYIYLALKKLLDRRLCGLTLPKQRSVITKCLSHIAPEREIW